MNKRVPLAIVGALLAGVVLYFLLGRGHDKAAPPPQTASGSAAPIEHHGGGSGSGEQHGDGPQQQVLIDDDPNGKQRLEGQVLDADDQPVGGATVVLSSNPPRTATSEGDGSFAFDNLVARPYQIAARASAGVAGPLTVRLTAKTEPVILKLHPASQVAVEVVDDKGNDVDGATVELRGLDTQTATTAKGKATITPVVPGGYQLAAWAPGFAHATQWINVAGDSQDVRVALRHGAEVAGRVLTEAGAPVAGARVLYYGASDWSQQSDDCRDAQVTDGDGKFKFDAIAAGSWRFEASHPDYAPGSSAIVSLDGNTAVDNVAITVPAGSTISGTVVDKDKQPVASARVRIGVAGAGVIASPPRQVFSGADGTFLVKGMPMRALEAVAVGDNGASDTTPVDASKGDVAGIQLVVDVTGTISGVVVDSSGDPIEGAQVSAFPDFQRNGAQGAAGDFSSWRLRGFPQDLTDAGGHFTLVGLVSGEYKVRASREESRRGRRGGGRDFAMGDGVPAKTGDTAVKIVLPEDGGLKGKVAYSDGTAPTAFTVSIGFDQQPVATKDGSFELDDLSPKDYQVEIRGNGFEAHTVSGTVEAGKTTDLGTITIAKGRTLKGVVVANGSPVPGANVYAGAQIFGNGTSNQAAFGGPPGAQNTKTATTDENGLFTISGLGPRAVAVIAESDQLGRSTAIRLVNGDPSEQNLTLTLLPFGSMSGTVTDGGKIASGQIVSVQSVNSPGAMYGVASGDDGTYRLDRLAPDTYKVSAMTGMNPMRGMGFFSKTITVTSGQEAHVDVAIERGSVTLAVSAKADKPVSGVAFAISGAGFVAKNGAELQMKYAAQGDGHSKFAVLMLGQPASLTELTAGPYSVCVEPLPSEVQGMQGFQYMQDHGDDLPAFCNTVTVTDSPDQQAVTVAVQIPALIKDN